MSISAARLRSLYRRQEEAHKCAFMSNEAIVPIGTRLIAADHRNTAHPKRSEIVKAQIGTVIQRELERAGLA